MSKKPKGRPPQDLRGQRFGRLVCIERLMRTGKIAKWVCRCDCGSNPEISISHLTKGTTKSCGCLQKEGVAERRRTHGMWKSVEYAAWHHMKQRCNDSKHPAYKNYGGRGIKVCDRWQHDFSAFLSDMGYRPSPQLSLERKNNDGPYSPDNCKWATRSEQKRNQRSHKRLTAEKLAARQPY